MADPLARFSSLRSRQAAARSALPVSMGVTVPCADAQRAAKKVQVDPQIRLCEERIMAAETREAQSRLQAERFRHWNAADEHLVAKIKHARDTGSIRSSNRHAEATSRHLAEALQLWQSEALCRSADSGEVAACPLVESVLHLLSSRNHHLSAKARSGEAAKARARNKRIAEHRDVVAEQELSNANCVRSEKLQEIGQYEERIEVLERTREELVEESKSVQATFDERVGGLEENAANAVPHKLQKYPSRASHEALASSVSEARTAEFVAVQKLERAAEQKEMEIQSSLAVQLKECDQRRQMAESRIARAEHDEREKAEEIADVLQERAKSLMEQQARAESSLLEVSESLEAEQSHQIESIELCLSRTEREEEAQVNQFVEEGAEHFAECSHMLEEAKEEGHAVREQTREAEQRTQLAQSTLSEAQERSLVTKEHKWQLSEKQLSNIAAKTDEDLQRTRTEVERVMEEAQMFRNSAEESLELESAIMENEVVEFLREPLEFEQEERAALEAAIEMLCGSEERAGLLESEAYADATSTKMIACQQGNSWSRDANRIRHQEAKSLEALQQQHRRQVSKSEQHLEAIRWDIDRTIDSIFFATQQQREAADIQNGRLEQLRDQECSLKHEAENQRVEFETLLDESIKDAHNNHRQESEAITERLSALGVAELETLENLQVLALEATDEEAAHELEAKNAVESGNAAMEESLCEQHERAQMAVEKMVEAYQNEEEEQTIVEDRLVAVELWEIDEQRAAGEECDRRVRDIMEQMNACMEDATVHVRVQSEEREVEIARSREYEEGREDAASAERNFDAILGSATQVAEKLALASRHIRVEHEESAWATEEKAAAIRRQEEEELVLIKCEERAKEEQIKETIVSCELRLMAAEQQQAADENSKVICEATLNSNLEIVEQERRENVQSAFDRISAAERALLGFVKCARDGERRALDYFDRASEGSMTPVVRRSRETVADTLESRPSVLSARSSVSGESVPGWGSLTDLAKRSRYQSPREQN